VKIYLSFLSKMGYNMFDMRQDKLPEINSQKRRIAMKYVCDVCAWEYDEEAGYPDGGIAPGTKWEDVPDDFECPLCSVGKDQFSEV
jgi:rubredoxin